MSHDPHPPLETGLLASHTEQVARIIAAAEECFGGHGYSGTSMREIAESAKVSKSLLHYHFQSKEHLFLEVLVRIYNRLAARISEAVESQQSPAKRALMSLDALFESLKENPDFHVQARIWASSLSDERLRPHATRMRQHLRAELIRTIQRILGPAIDPLPISEGEAADLLWATVSGLGLLAASDEDSSRADAAFRSLRNLIALLLGEGESA